VHRYAACGHNGHKILFCDVLDDTPVNVVHCASVKGQCYPAARAVNLSSSVLTLGPVMARENDDFWWRIFGTG
jgi:hypothetical protein